MKLFGSSIEPCCNYCELVKKTADDKMLLCVHHGVVAQYYSCKKFKYAPLKRVPRKNIPLPEYQKEEFEL